MKRRKLLFFTTVVITAVAATALSAIPTTQSYAPSHGWPVSFYEPGFRQSCFDLCVEPARIINKSIGTNENQIPAAYSILRLAMDFGLWIVSSLIIFLIVRVIRKPLLRVIAIAALGAAIVFIALMFHSNHMPTIWSEAWS